MMSHDPVELVPYDPQWPQAFRRIRDRLLVLLPQALSIDHIGSTSISGMLTSEQTITALCCKIPAPRSGNLNLMPDI